MGARLFRIEAGFLLAPRVREPPFPEPRDAMLIQEVLTDVPRAEVMRRAREWFTTRFSPYAGFIEDESEGHLRFETEAGELILGVTEQDGQTLVRGSSSRLHHELSQFLITLSPPEEVRQNVTGPGVSGAG